MKPETTPVAILCGGLGTRLGPLTVTQPKPLVPVNGRPFLEHQVDLLANQGFRRFVLLTGYLGEQIEARFRAYRSTELSFAFQREREPQGTGGALLDARRLLGSGFLVLNGDSYLAVDYGALLARLLASAPETAGVLAAYRNPDPSAVVEANNLALDGETIVAYLKREKDPRLTHVDAGAGAYREAVFGFFGDDQRRPLSLEETVWPRAIAARRLLAFPAPERPWDIGTPARLAAFAARLRQEAAVA